MPLLKSKPDDLRDAPRTNDPKLLILDALIDVYRGVFSICITFALSADGEIDETQPLELIAADLSAALGASGQAHASLLERER